VKLLPLAKFAYNNLTTEITNVISFFTNYDYEPIAYKKPNLMIKNNDTIYI